MERPLLQPIYAGTKECLETEGRRRRRTQNNG